MVKSLISVAVATLLLGLSIFFEYLCVNRNFSDFKAELEILSEKIEEERATEEDANTVLKSWEKRKDKLYVWIPHNDITRIDDYISETVPLVARREYTLAGAKIGIVLHLTECLPDTYRPALGNIF